MVRDVQLLNTSNQKHQTRTSPKVGVRRIITNAHWVYDTNVDHIGTMWRHKRTQRLKYFMNSCKDMHWIIKKKSEKAAAPSVTMSLLQICCIFDATLIKVLHNAEFLHVFHFKIPYFSRLKFPVLQTIFQTIFNRNGSYSIIFGKYQSSVNI